MDDSAVLIVGPSWVGDMVMAQSLFRSLKARRPGAAIDVLAPQWCLAVLERMPEVRMGIAMPLAHGEFAPGNRWRLARGLREGAYNQAIVLPRSMKAALVPWFAGIPRRTGFRGEMRYGLINDMRSLDRAVLDQTVKRFVALGMRPGESPSEVPFPRLEVSPENQQRLTDRLSLATGTPCIALMPGAEYGPAKCWPLENFRELAGLLRVAGYEVWVLGSEADRPAGDYIAAAGAARNLCGDTTLTDAIDLLGLVEQAVSNDSGLMHVAAAAGSHVSAIYGSSTPAYTPPLTDKCHIYYLDIECSPCFARQCPLGHLRCLKEISAASVFAGIQTGRSA